MSKTEPHQLTAREALHAVATQSLSIVDLAQSCLDRILAREPELRAWVYFDPDGLLAEAKAKDSVPANDRPPLHGLIVGVKDIFDTQAMPTSYGSKAYAGHRPVANSAAVALLREAGAIVAGKTESTEFAGWTPTVTRNPRNLAHTPGGSSSGSAAAVADYMIPFAIGTQTLGSVIRPASYCGVVGFKPSYGRISRVGVKPLAESLDTVGFLARDVEDVEFVYRVLSSADPVDFEGGTMPRLGFCRGPRWNEATVDARNAIENFVQEARASGANIVDLKLSSSFEDLPQAAKVIHDFELYRGFCDERNRQPDKLSKSFQQGVERARKWTVAAYEDAVRRGDSLRREFDALAKDYDAIITLSATGQAPSGLASTGDPVLNSAWTLLYAPCVSIPVLQGQSGLPIGLQVVAPFLRDRDALRAAHWLAKLHAATGTHSTVHA